MRRTYDREQPWIAYRYPLPDWATRLIGVAPVQTECFICAKRRVVWKRLWWAGPEQGHRIRAELLREHRHSRLCWQPLYWAVQLANYAGWQQWRKEQGTHLEAVTEQLEGAHGALDVDHRGAGATPPRAHRGHR